MNHSDIAALMRGMAPVVRDFVVEATKPLVERIAELERDLAEAKAVDHADAIRDAVADAVRAIPLPKDGVDGAPGRDGLDGAAGKDGVDGKDGLPGADGRDGVDGKDGAPGADGAPGERGADGAPGRDGVDGKDGDQGKEGPPGKLAIVRQYAPGVHYEAAVVTHKGATWQAVRDTGSEPPHEDWICLAAPGAPARQIEIKGTFDPEAAYDALNVVALNGGTFIAKHDAPGMCPGEGWQLMSAQGKRGLPGESRKGDPGKSIKGDAGPPVISMTADDNGLLTLVNADGSMVECDLYPLLSKIDRRG